ncbi:c-type cytochrome [Salinispirillum sp. LH 10-3-1]|uniref:C-type cytochrome n=1 Tax=Salinispirillum sp. LH 10-3-1 TaxID=2952525 RepID=A0AB38YGD4_9GAMM
MMRQCSKIFLLLLLSSGVFATEFAPGEVVQRFCASCHARGIAGAPRSGDVSDWSARLAQHSFDEIAERGWQGSRRMPPKGYCQRCSYDDFVAALEEMLPQQLLP